MHCNFMPSEIVHVGLMVALGSRDENALNNGITHFIEHTVFKGTTNRKSHHILTYLERLGGDINAFTTREKTCYYASSLKQYADKAVEIVCDIVFNSTFPNQEIEKEKKVVIEEIEMYEDTPDESIYDDFYALLFKKHPLGYNILGTDKNVNSFTGNQLVDYKKTHYTTDNIVLSVVGDLSFEAVKKMAEKYLGAVPKSSYKNKRKKPTFAPQFYKEYQKDFTQTHCIMGSPAYSRNSDKRYALTLLSNILGGGGMSSRLSMAVREKHGLTYSISSSYSAYEDAGVFSIYFAADGKKIPKCFSLIEKELKLLRDTKLSSRVLHQAKVQFRGQMAMLNENPSGHMQVQARSLLNFDRIISLEEYLQNMDKVSVDDMLNVANEVLNPSAISTAIYKEE